VLFRVWDIFLVDGADVLFRVALAILTLCEEELLKCQSMPSLYIALKSLPTRMWQADKLIQVRPHMIDRLPPLTSSTDRGRVQEQCASCRPSEKTQLSSSRAEESFGLIYDCCNWHVDHSYNIADIDMQYDILSWN
jgi:hypothetical protein